MVHTSIRIGQAAAVACTAIFLVACTGGVSGSGSSSTTGSAQYTVGGTVSGLSGTGLVLATNTGESLSVGGNGSFTLKTTYPSGSPYYVLVQTQPSAPAQTCVPTNAAGTVANASVTAITVVCTDKTAAVDTIGGIVVGLSGSGLVLQINGTDTLAVSSDGTFKFPTAMPSGSQYEVSVLSPPVNPYEDCVVLNGKDTTANSDIGNIAVSCTVNINPTHTIGGTASGVSGTLVLENNGRDDLTITADGPFKFPLAIPSGSVYSVTTKSAAGAQSQACIFTNATGLVGNSDISNVTVACTANVSLKASVSGLSGTGLTLQNTANGDNLAVNANGISAFATGLASGDPYSVSVTGQPTNPSQTCVVTNGAGAASPGATVTVTCTTNTFTVSGVVAGLPDPTQGANLNLTLQNNLGDDITISPTAKSPVTFTFAIPVPSGSAYSVTVKAQPGIDTSNGTPGVLQTSTVCVVSGNSGTVTNANITNVAVNCVRPLGFAYVTNGGDNTISPYVIDSDTGALLPSGPPVGTGTNPSAAAARGSNLYASNKGSSDLSGYNIDPNTGSLTPLSGSPFALGLNVPTSVATDSTMITPGLYVSNSGVSPGSISAFTVDSTGAQLTSIAGSPFAAQVGPTAGLLFNGGDNPTFYSYYLETDSSSNTVSSYLVDSTTGALSALPAMPNGPAATGAGPDSVAGIQIFVPQAGANFDHVYVANSGDGTISIYSMNTQTGLLTALPTGPVTVGSGLSAVAASQAGNYLLASASQGIWAFSTDSGGLLVTVPNSPFAAGVGPGPLAALFNYVYVVNTVDQTISAFTQDSASGQLTPVAGAPVQTGRTPSSIVVITRPNYNPG